MTEQDHWTRQCARELRALAEVLEQTQGLEMGQYSWGGRKMPRVIVYVESYADVQQMAKLLGVNCGPGGYQGKDYGAWHDGGSLCVDVTTPAITIPRACEYCDQKHDCTHVDGMVQA